MASPAPGPGPSRFVSPETYTPKHLAEKILTSKAALEGERKQVTVLFADLKGSMELLADRDPEEARKILDPVLEHMIEAVHRYEGTVNQVMGDGIMALFGAPLAHEDHAVRACYAALRMQENVKKSVELSRGVSGAAVRIRIGLNSGEVVVRSIGSDLKMDYTAVGLTTHLAARMEQMASPGAIFLTAQTARLAEGFVQVASLGVMPVKGLTEPIEIFELTSKREDGSRLVAGAAHGLTRFVGRDLEIDQLERALERAEAGNGQVAAVCGEPGVGKSRLCLEFTECDVTRDWKVLHGRAISYGTTTTYLPVIQVFKAYFGIETGDTGSIVREKIRSRLLAVSAEFAETDASPFQSLFDIGSEDPDWLSLDASQRRQRVHDACVRVLLHESQQQPLLLMFEDLHWIDYETQTFLDALAESLPGRRIFLLVSYRPEYSHGWGSRTYYTQVRLDPLRARSLDDLLDSLLGAAPELETIRELLITRTEGNPFFLEESVRTLVETEMLVGPRGDYRVGVPFEGMRIPATVQSVLAARIDRLDSEDKALLQAASVVGKDVTLDVLASVVNTHDADLAARLRRLQQAEFLYETRRFTGVEYTFKHALTHEAAYSGLLHDRRRALHAKLVEVIERLYGDRLNEHVESLARHATRGELWSKAVDYLKRAGIKAVERSASREAIWYLEQALETLTHIPRTRESREVGIDVRFALRTALFLSGDLRRIEPHLIQAEQDAAAIEDSGRLGWVAAYRSALKWHQGESRDAKAGARQASELGDQVQDLFLRVFGRTYTVYASYCLGQYGDAQAACHSIIELLPGDLARHIHHSSAALPVVGARHYLAISKAEVGAFDDGLVDATEALPFAEERHHPFSIAMAHWSMGYVHRVRGDMALAAASLESAFATARKHRLAWWLAFGSWLLGNVQAHRGDYESGLPLLNQAQNIFESRSIGAFRTLALVHLAEARLLAGDRASASSAAAQARARAIHSGERGFEAWARHVNAEIALDDARVDMADTEFQSALALAGELNMRPLVAHCHFGLGKLYRCTGDAAKAHEHLTTAATMYREMGMGFWLEKAEAEQKA